MIALQRDDAFDLQQACRPDVPGYERGPYETLARAMMRSARVPASLQSQEFGLWTIKRQTADGIATRLTMGWPHITVLCRWTQATLHLPHGHVVMEDSRLELARHLPIWMAARGRVLISGLGLGCVVRGLLPNLLVEHIDVLELDPDIARIVGAEFADNLRVTIHVADAMTWPIDGRRWDYAWHDVCTEDDVGLQPLHMKLMRRFWDHVGRQGAWGFPREAANAANIRFIGAPRTSRNKRRRS